MRTALLASAQAEFAAHGFQGASLSRIAREAGATPAMAHYYFGSKRGLYRAMLEYTLGPLLATMREQVATLDGEKDPLPDFLRAYMSLLANNPSIPALLLRDVLHPGADMRDEFITNFASRGAGTVRTLIQQGIAAGRMREDLDTELTALSLLSLAAFPFLGAPVATRVLGYSTESDKIEGLVAHTLDLFYNGTGTH